MTDTTQGDRPAIGPTVHPAVLDRLLAEAARIGEDARDVLQRDVGAGLGAIDRLRTQHELGVVVSCLGFAVAWLLEQKAVAAGELAKASPPPLASALARPRLAPERIDPVVLALGDRARAFGARIERLAAG